MSDENPLVQGGQGRSHSDLVEDCTSFGAVALAAVALFLFAMWMGR